MAERSSNRVLWIVLIIVGLLVSCGLGTLLGGVVGYGIGRNAATSYHTPSQSPEGPQRFVPEQDVPIPVVPMPDLPEELRPFELMETRSALVVEVTEDSPAASAGLRVGDLILAVDGKQVNDTADLADIISDHQPGDRIELDIIRQDRERTIEVELGRNKDDGTPWLGIRYRAFPLVPDMRFRTPEQQFEFNH